MAARKPTKKTPAVRKASGAAVPAKRSTEVMPFDASAAALQQLEGLFDPAKVKGQALAVAQGGVGWPMLSPRAGMFSMKRQPLGKILDVVILNYVAENLFYDKPYNPTQQTTPACQAVGKPGEDWSSLAPPATWEHRIADACNECRYSEWESAAKYAKEIPGKTVISDRAKMCGNYLRIAVINESFLKGGASTPAVAKIAPTSTKAFDVFLRRLVREDPEEGLLHYPPYLFVTRMSLIGGVGNAPFSWDFEPIRLLERAEVEQLSDLRRTAEVELARLQLRES